MKIAVVGISHNTSPIEVREKFSFTESMKIEGANWLLDKSIEELIIISTCNRSEIYIASEDIDVSIDQVKEFYKEFFSFPQVEEYLFTKKGQEVVAHLYMVTAGLDSVVLGEDQILGQIKEAMTFSMELGFSNKIINRLFMDAIAEGKKIRSNIKISEIPLSTSYIGIKLLKEKVGSLEGKKAFVIGAGKISRLSIEYLLEEGLAEIYHTNRTHGRVKEIFKEFSSLKPVEYKNRYEILKKVDILITATGAPHTIISYEDMPELKNKLHIMDLAIPRDVDDRIRENKKVILYHIDDLKKVSHDNLLEREKLSGEAMTIISDGVDKYMEWLSHTKVDPVIESLNDRCSIIKKSTMEYIDRKIDLDIRERKIVDKMLTSALKRVIREPIKTLKKTEAEKSEEYMKIVKELFQL